MRLKTLRKVLSQAVSSQVWPTSTPDRREEGEHVGRGVLSLRFQESSGVRRRGITGEVLHLSPAWAETLSRGRRPAFPSKCASPPRSAEHNAPILCAAGAQHIVLARPRPPIGAVHPSHCIEAQPYTFTCRTLWSPCSRLTVSTTSSQEDVTRIPGIWAGKAGR